MSAAIARPAAPLSPWHAGERRMQEWAGVSDKAEGLAPMIRPFFLDQHRLFYPLLPVFYVGTEDGEGRVWASILAGRPGFVTAPDPQHLRIAAKPAFGDPISLEPGHSVGGLGLESHTRRRNRINGTVESWDPSSGTLSLAVDQSFGNCPKYITVRKLEVDPVALAAVGQPRPVVRGSTLGAEQRAFIARASTFYIATSSADPLASRSARGCDVSHRGGAPGFVQTAEDGLSLRFPDYVGNNMLLTFGNLALNPKAGLLFIDFATGDTLQLTGEAEVSGNTAGLPGAQRSVAFQVHAFVQVSGAVPVRASGPEQLSPYNPLLPTAASAAPAGTLVPLLRVRQEAAGIKTFEFAAPPGLTYKPGQYASFDFQGLEAGGQITNRTWTVSSHPDETKNTKSFTITVKKAGLASGWLHERAAPGLRLLLRGVQGDFTLEPTKTPLLLVAAGIGITPMRVMWLDAVKRHVSVVLLYSVRSVAEAAFLGEFEAAAAAAPCGVARLVVSITGGGGSKGGSLQEAATAVGSSPPCGDAVAWRSGRISQTVLAEAVPDVAGRHVYVCGPGGFMDSVTESAAALGVLPDAVHQESFNF